MDWTELDFSKHRGKTLPQVALTDPDWFFWAIEEHALLNHGYGEEAELVVERVRSIRIPGSENGSLLAEWTLDTDGSVKYLDVVKAEVIAHGKSPNRVYAEVIDLSFPRSCKNFDKLAYKIVISRLKVTVFGDPKFKMTKKRSGEFLANDDNFQINQKTATEIML